MDNWWGEPFSVMLNFAKNISLRLFSETNFIFKNNFGAEGSEIELFWGGFE